MDGSRTRPADFAGYLRNETKVTFPWSMIDKITPRPDAKIKALLDSDGFEDSEVIVTAKTPTPPHSSTPKKQNTL